MTTKLWMSRALMAATVMLGGWSVSEAKPQEAQGAPEDPAEEMVLMCKTTVGEIASGEGSGNDQQPGVEPRGFGCPFNGYQCHSHCRSINRRGGYCGGFIRKTCYCYR